jgi:hypothetical protein
LFFALRFKRADMWTSGGAQKLPVADVPNLIDSINRKLSDPHKIASGDVEQRLRSAGAHVNLNQFLEALSAISAPAAPQSPLATETASIASAHLALLPGQFSDSLMTTCLATHGRSKLIQLLRAIVIPQTLLREALVPVQSPAAINYTKLVLISAGLTQPSPPEADVRAAMHAAGMFTQAERFIKAAVSSGYNDDLSMPAGARTHTRRFCLFTRPVVQDLRAPGWR